MTPVRGVVLLGAVLVTLAGCYVVQPVSPAPSLPAQGSARWVWTGRTWVWQPGAPGPAGPAPTAPAPRAEGAPAPPPAPTGQNCQTVVIETHSETHVMPNGQRVTVQVPTHQRQICR